MKEKLSSRKFLMSLFIFVITLVLFVFGKISEDGFLQTLMTVYAIYVGGNISTKFIKPRSD